MSTNLLTVVIIVAGAATCAGLAIESREHLDAFARGGLATFIFMTGLNVVFRRRS